MVIKYIHSTENNSISAFSLLRILLILLAYLHFLPGYWPISILLNKYKWQIFTLYKSILPKHWLSLLRKIRLYQGRTPENLQLEWMTQMIQCFRACLLQFHLSSTSRKVSRLLRWSSLTEYSSLDLIITLNFLWVPIRLSETPIVA